MSKLFLNKITLFLVLPLLVGLLLLNRFSPQTLSSLFSSNNVKGVASGLTAQEIRNAGLYDVTAPEFGADPTGQRDSTQAIQRAIDAAYKASRVMDPNRGAVFFPEGTYLISDTLNGATDRKLTRRNSVLLIGSTLGERPKIVLKENTFRSGGKKAMLHIFACVGPRENDPNSGAGCIPSYNDQRSRVNQTDGDAAMQMASGAMNLEFVIKPGNPEAIGIRFAGAQNNVLSNIKITAEGNSYAGIYSLIGTDSTIQNIEITGGQIGLFGGSSEWPSFNNVRLINQSVAAVAGVKSAGPLSLNGFYIEKESAPVITDSPINYNYSAGTNSGGGYALSDGVIKVKNGSQTPVIDNRSNRQVTMQNVFFENAPVITGQGSSEVRGNANGWSRVNVYAKIMTATAPNEAVRIKNGSRVNEDLVNVTTNVSAPNSNALLAKHGVPVELLPSPDEIMSKSKRGVAGYVNVLDRGITPIQVTTNIRSSSPDMLQPLLEIVNDTNTRFVLFPRGIYLVSNTLDITNTNVALVGVGNFLSEIRNHPNMTANAPKYVIRTPDDKDASPIIAFLRLNNTPEPNKPLGNIHIRSGKSILYGSMYRGTGFTPGRLDSFVPRNKIYMSDNAGGKFYALGTGGFGLTTQWYPGFRGIKVDSTQMPITFYGLNPEDGGYTCSPGATDHKQCRPNPISMQVEIRNSKNIAIRGFKCEDYNSVNIFNSSNIFVNGAGGCTDWLFNNVDQALLLNMASKYNGTSANRPNEGRKALFEEIYNGTQTVDLRMRHALTSFERGALPDFSVWDVDFSGGIDDGSDPGDTGDTGDDSGSVAECGNSIVEEGESCDLGSQNGACPSACSSRCSVNTCGGGDQTSRTNWQISGNRGGEATLTSEVVDGRNQLNANIVKFPAVPVYVYKPLNSFAVQQGKTYQFRVPMRASIPDTKLSFVLTDKGLWSTQPAYWTSRVVSVNRVFAPYTFRFVAPTSSPQMLLALRIEGSQPLSVSFKDFQINEVR